uniref:NP1 n=1 Tax=Gallus gallus enteric parvovirus TaxID=1633569 RepID=A0A0D5ZD36_9VIRU|nr:NP1 [Gallus gallus enteric parvovirus]
MTIFLPLLSFFATNLSPHLHPRSISLNLLASYSGGTSNLNGWKDTLESGGLHFLISCVGITITLHKLKR